MALWRLVIWNNWYWWCSGQRSLIHHSSISSFIQRCLTDLSRAFSSSPVSIRVHHVKRGYSSGVGGKLSRFWWHNVTWMWLNPCRAANGVSGMIDVANSAVKLHLETAGSKQLTLHSVMTSSKTRGRIWETEKEIYVIIWARSKAAHEPFFSEITGENVRVVRWRLKWRYNCWSVCSNAVEMEFPPSYP